MKVTDRSHAWPLTIGYVHATKGLAGEQNIPVLFLTEHKENK
jgi:hypothetical protein